MRKPEPDPAARVAAFFDRHAERFPVVGREGRSLGGRLIDALFRRGMSQRYERVIEGCAPVRGAGVLDIGCGPGMYAVELARRGASRVLGIDFAPRMIDLATRNADRAGVSPHCEFQVMSLLEIDSTETFDFVLAIGVLDYVEDASAFLAKAVALMKRRAFLSFPRSGGVLAWQRRFRYRWKCPLYLYSRADIERLFAGVGIARFRIDCLSREWFVTVEGETEQKGSGAIFPTTGP